MRDEFEASYAELANMPLSIVRRQRANGTYADDDIEAAWIWWQRSRAALVIILPRKGGPNGPADDFERGYQAGVNDCRDAIKQAGARTK